MAVAAVVIIIRGIMAVVMAVGVATVVIITLGKGSGENPEKSSLRKKGGFTLGLLMQKGAQVGVIGAPLDALPV